MENVEVVVSANGMIGMTFPDSKVGVLITVKQGFELMKKLQVAMFEYKNITGKSPLGEDPGKVG